MKAAIYARCSTTEQTVHLQLDGLREYAQVRGLEIVEEYVDEGISGSKVKRPALDRMLAEAHRRRFDTVLVWKLDRLGRSLGHLIRLVDTLGSLGVDLVSLGDPGLDTTSPHGRLIFAVMGAVAEFERDLIRERTRAGLASARRRGRQLGRHEALDSTQKARARRMANAGQSHRQIAETLGVARGRSGGCCLPAPKVPAPKTPRSRARPRWTRPSYRPPERPEFVPLRGALEQPIKAEPVAAESAPDSFKIGL